MMESAPANACGWQCRSADERSGKGGRSPMPERPFWCLEQWTHAPVTKPLVSKQKALCVDEFGLVLGSGVHFLKSGDFRCGVRE
jgi:hypothetical protein